MVAWCLENAQHFCILIFNSHTKANQIPEQPNEVDACLVVLWIVWILFLFERLNYPLIIAIRSLQPELIHIYTVVYDSVGWAKVAATFEGRRISGQKMERGIPFLIDIIHKIFIEVNDQSSPRELRNAIWFHHPSSYNYCSVYEDHQRQGYMLCAAEADCTMMVDMKPLKQQ